MVSVVDVGLTFGSCRYPGTAWPPLDPAAYCARTTYCSKSLAGMSRNALSTFSFSSRTASGSNATGGSIANRLRTCNRWFWTMSRMLPACSK